MFASATIRFIHIIGFMALLVHGTPAHARVSVVLVQIPASNGHFSSAELRAQLSRLVEPLLARKLTIVPFSHYYEVARQQKVAPRKITSTATATTIGSAAGVDYVAYLLPIQHPSGIWTLRVELVDAKTGESIYSRQYSLLKRRLTHKAATRIHQDLIKQLESPNQPLLPLVSPNRVPVTPPPSTATDSIPLPEPSPLPDLPPQALLPHSDDTTIDSNQARQVTPPTPPPPSVPELTPSVAPPAPVPMTSPLPPPPQPAVAVATPAVDSNAKARYPLRISLGETVFSRVAYVTSPNNTLLACFCNSNSQYPPLFSRTQLELELFPLAFGQTGRWWEGFGLSVAASIGEVAVNEQLASSTNSTLVKSAMWTTSSSLGYRAVLWDKRWALSLQPQLGYDIFAFPINSAAVFPSLGYQSVWFGLQAYWPVVSFMALESDFRYLWREVAFLDTSALGAQTTAGYGLHWSLGLRFLIVHHLELRTLLFYDNYVIPFAGTTNLSQSTSNANDVRVKDTLWNGMLSVGYVF